MLPRREGAWLSPSPAARVTSDPPELSTSPQVGISMSPKFDDRKCLTTGALAWDSDFVFVALSWHLIKC